MLDQSIKVALDGGVKVGTVNQDPDFDISKLRGFSEIRRPDECLFAIDHNAFRMETGARDSTFYQAPRIVNTSGSRGPGHSSRMNRCANRRSSAADVVVSPGAR